MDSNSDCPDRPQDEKSNQDFMRVVETSSNIQLAG